MTYSDKLMFQTSDMVI